VGDAAPLTTAFVDVPGHERFIETMLAGTGPAPSALLVVAADDGWSAQTEEHVEVLDLLAVPGLAVALTKVDLVGADRVEVVRDEVVRRLRGTSLEGAPVVPIDGPRGTGVPELARLLATRLAERPGAVDHDRPRLWVDRAFPVRGAGTVVTGTLGGGTIRLGDTLRVLPAGHEARVRGLESLGTSVEQAPPGTRVAVNLAGVDRDQVGRGDALVGGGPWRTTVTVDAVVRALPGRTIDRAGAWRVHIGAVAVTARVLPLTDPVVGPPWWAAVTSGGGSASAEAVETPRASAEAAESASVSPTAAGGGSASAEAGEAGVGGTVGAVRLLLDRPLPLVAGDRLVLREGGRRLTVGGGQVADPDPGEPPRGRPAREARVAGLLTVAAATSPAARLRALLALTGGSRPGPEALAAAGVSAAGPRPPGVVAVGAHAALEEARDRWVEAAVAVATAAGTGVDRERVVEGAATAGAPPDLAASMPDHLVAAGRLVRTAGGLTTPGGADEVDSDRRARDVQLLEALSATPFAPPNLTGTARGLGLDHRDVNRLVQAGAIVRTGDLAFAADAVVQAVEALRRLEAAVGPFTAAQARTAWGTTRRFAIPLLEHLDRTRVTRFDGRLRTLRADHRARTPQPPG
jgi:selenocysteine-specific elongation factor